MIANRIGTAQRNTLEGLGLTVIEADPMRPSTVRSLHLPYAAALFLTGDDDVDNLSIAMLALTAAGRRPADLPPLVLAVRIDRENFAVELDLRSTASRAVTACATIGFARIGKAFALN